MLSDLAHIDEPLRWKDLRVLVKVESERYFKATGVIEKAIRYYIGSKEADARFYQQNVRGHWAIENKLHWSLNVNFQEDAGRKRNKNAVQNFFLINKVAINILENDQTRNISVRRKKNIAAWDLKYLLKLLNF